MGKGRFVAAQAQDQDELKSGYPMMQIKPFSALNILLIPKNLMIY